MNFLGPIGLTLALVWVVGWILERLNRHVGSVEYATNMVPSWIAGRLSVGIDYRLILIGSLIPDLIDKPLVFLADPEFVNMSLRSFGHSLIGAFSMLLIVWFITRRWQRLPVLSFGFALVAHLVFDRMWEMAEVLLWPVLGYVLPEQNIPFSHWYQSHFNQLPNTLPDFVGIGVIAAFTGYTIWNRALTTFLKSGQFS